MWVLEKIGDSFNIPVKQYLCSSSSDLASLPKGNFGDRAVIVEGATETVVYCNEDGVWETPK